MKREEVNQKVDAKREHALHVQQQKEQGKEGEECGNINYYLFL